MLFILSLIIFRQIAALSDGTNQFCDHSEFVPVTWRLNQMSQLCLVCKQACSVHR